MWTERAELCDRTAGVLGRVGVELGQCGGLGHALGLSEGLGVLHTHAGRGEGQDQRGAPTLCFVVRSPPCGG